jgi:hypothetical protein
MNRRTLAPRLWYVAGAIGTAAIAGTLLIARRDGFSLLVSALIIVPAALFAGMASLVLITRDGLAGLARWLLAGLLVPILSVIVFTELNYITYWVLTGYRMPRDIFYGAMIAVGAMITIPMGVLVSGVLYWAIRKRFFGSDRREF